MASPVDALLAAYPQQLSAGAAAAWVSARRALLAERVQPAADPWQSASSGCAASGAAAHARTLAADAARALRRLDAGTASSCEGCGATMPFERLDSVPTAVTCPGCAPASRSDDRWCR